MPNNNLLSPETTREIQKLAQEMGAAFSPPEFIPGCEVLSVADANLYATGNGWIEAICGIHNNQRCRWKGKFSNVQVGDYVDVIYFRSFGLFEVLARGGTGAINSSTNVWPQAGNAGISDTQYDDIDNFFDALANGDQGIIGEGAYTTDYAGGHATIPTGADVKGSGIDATTLTSADTTATLAIAGETLLEQCFVLNTYNGTNGVAVKVLSGGYARIDKVYGYSGSATNNIGFYLYDCTALLIDCEAYAATGSNNYAVWAYDNGSGTAVTIRGGYFDGDVVADQAGATITLDGPTITGSVTEANGGTIAGHYYDSNFNHIFRDSTADVFPGGDTFGLFSRHNLALTYDYHYTSSADASALTWAGAPFSGAPTVSVANSMLLPYGSNAANRYFGYITLPAAGSFYIRTLLYTRNLTGLNGGIRVDDGTDNNYMELYIAPNTTYTGLQMIQTKVRTGGGGITTTSYPNFFIRPEYAWLAILVNITGPTTGAYWGINPYGFLQVVQSGPAITPTRGGVYFTGSPASNYVIAYDSLRTQGV